MILNIGARLIRPAAALVAACLLLPALVQGQDSEREALEQQLEEVREQIGRIQARIDRTLEDRDRLNKALADAERAVGDARRAQTQTDSALILVRDEIEQLEAHQVRLTEQVSQQARLLGEQLAMAYRSGSQSRLKMLLNQDDPRQLSRQMAYYGYLSRARLKTMEQLRDALAEYKSNQQLLDDEAQRLSELLNERRQETRQLEAAMEQREQALEGIDKSLADDRQQLAGLEENAAELTRLIEALADVFIDVPANEAIPAFDDLKGQLQAPLQGAVIQSFGSRRGREMTWQGWLIEAERGAAVRSIAHGRVAYAEWLRGYGLLLIVDHGDGYMSLYAHNEALLRDVGDWVQPGEKIALAGRSGGVPRDALYFELRKNAAPIDPALWVKR